MIRYLYPDATTVLYKQIQFLPRLFLISALPIFSFSTTAQIKNPKELIFKNPVLISGVAGQDGAVYRFPKVDLKLDALVNKKVMFELYNANGHVMKHFTSEKASQTEGISINDLLVGIYFVKATTGDNSAVQRIVKFK